MEIVSSSRPSDERPQRHHGQGHVRRNHRAFAFRLPSLAQRQEARRCVRRIHELEKLLLNGNESPTERRVPKAHLSQGLARPYLLLKRGTLKSRPLLRFSVLAVQVEIQRDSDESDAIAQFSFSIYFDSILENKE
jgi:hypothetical protein